VIDCKPGSTLTTILAGEIITTHDLAFAQFYLYAGSFDHPFKPDDRRTRIFLRNSVDKTATIEDKCSFAGHHQAKSAPRIAYIKRLKVSIQQQDWFQHHCSVTLRIIARVFTQLNTPGCRINKTIIKAQ
jgi:hypothetical protein